MNGHTSRGLRMTLLVYAISLVLSGLFHMFSPQTMGGECQAIERVFGGAMLAFALGAGLAYLERAWDRVKIVVLMQVAWMSMYTITLAWGILSGGLRSDAWPATITGAVVASLLVFFYLREQRLQGQVPSRSR